MATLNLSKIKYMSETNLKKFASLIISLSSQVTDIENKCIKPYVDGELYPRDSYVSYNGYIYQATATNQDSAFNETHWDKLSDDFNELTVADIEAMLGLSQEQLETMANLIADTEVRLDKTYSSSKIYQDIQQCLNDSKAFTLLELGKKIGTSYKIATTIGDMVDTEYIYLMDNGSTYDIYIVEKDTNNPVKIGDTSVDLSNYYTKTEIENDYLKKADADGKYATITTVGGKIDKTDIVDNLTSTDTDKPLSANQGKILNDTKLNKTDANKLNCVSIDNVSLKEYILTNFTEREKTYYLIAKTTCTDLPKASNFYITVETPGLYTYKVTAKELNDSNGRYVCTYRTISSSWTAWEKVLITGDITTTISDSSADTQVPSAKAVYDSTKYSSISLECPIDKSPLEFVVENMKDNTILYFNSWGNSSGATPDAWASYIGIRHKDHSNLFLIVISAFGDSRVNTYRNNTWSGWRRICTTSARVADVGKTVITLNTMSDITFGNVNGFYLVSNGICTVDITFNCTTTAPILWTTAYNSLPIPKSVFHASAPASGYDSAPLLINVRTDGTMEWYIDSAVTTNRTYYVHFSYPVAE